MAKYEITTKLTNITYDPHTNTYNYKETITDSVPLPISTPTHYTYENIKDNNKIDVGSQIGRIGSEPLETE